MNIETLLELWAKEAVAHGYIGFLVISKPKGIDRIFLNSEDIIDDVKRDCDNIILKEVIL